MKTLKNLLVLLLLILSVIMIYLGVKGGILPPTLTGAALVLIAVLFFIKEKK